MTGGGQATQAVRLGQSKGQSQGQGQAGTTTISTLAVQAGEQRLVVALLQAGSRLELKVVEMQPELGWLGSGFKEAAALQVLCSAHYY